jgi:CheY-like chemotaxis protein
MKKRMLVVDDDAAIRQSLKKILLAANYEVVLAADGQEAIDRFEPNQIDLIFLDLNLPVKAGWDVFERITGRHPFVPIIIMTGLPNQYPLARNAGVGALVEKPIEVPLLLKTVADLLAEPSAAHLQRLCGQRTDTRYLQAGDRNLGPHGSQQTTGG